MDPGRFALLVLGMHRSGTSALTRIVNLLGTPLGNDLLPAHPDNQAGFWEHREVVLLHDELLAALGTSWDDPRPIADHELEGDTVQPFRDRLRAILEREFEASPSFAIKDPRLCRLLPLWLPLLEEMNVRPLCILTGRHPDEVAASLGRRDEMPDASARLLWLTHVLAAEWHSRGCTRAFVTFDDLLNDWRGEMRRVAQTLGLNWEPALHQAANEIDAFLDDSLRHHRVADEEPAGGPWIERAWSAFRAGAHGEPERAAMALDRVSREVKVAGELFFPMVAETGRWREKAAARGRQVLELRRQLSEAGPPADPEAPAPDAAPAESTTPASESVAATTEPVPPSEPTAADSQVTAVAAEIRRAAGAGTTVLRTYDTPEGAPVVSIVIPLFNHVELTTMCLESLAEHTEDGTYEVILVDNGSSDATPDLLACLEGNVKILRNETNLGFATACNQGAELASTPNVLFLNNDIEAKPGWLPPLLDVLNSDPSVGIVGSRLLFPDGTIQHAGVALLGREQHQILLGAFHMHYAEPGDCAEAAQAMNLQVVTGACLLVRRSIFTDVGGFDTYFWNGCEDVDFCLKVRAKGWNVVYEPASALVHHESMSGPQRFSRTRSNEALLASRWFGKVEPDLIERADGTRALAPGTPMAPYRGLAAPSPDGAPASLALAAPDALTSIVILTRNGVEDTRLCLESIAEHTDQPHEVIVVDNGSTDGTIDYLRWRLEQVDNLRVVQNATNRGFAAGNNLGLSIAHGAQVVLLNNDTVVTPGWLAGLSAVLHAHPDCGLVGPMTNYASGPQVVANVPYQTLPTMKEFALDWACRHEGSDPARRLVGFCWLMRREVVDEIGGLDERFGLGNCEDDDYCLRVVQAGWTTRIARSVFIHHTGSRTFRSENIDYSAQLKANFEIFRDKWNLDPDASVDKPYPFLEVAKGPAHPRVKLPEVAGTHDLQDRGRWHRDRGLGTRAPRTVDQSSGSLDDQTYRLAVGLLPGDEVTGDTRALFARYGLQGDPPVWETTAHIAAQLGEKPLVLLLAPDVVVPDDALQEMLEIMKADPTVAAIGPRSNAAPTAQRGKPGYQDTGRDLRRFAARQRRKRKGQTRPAAHLGGFCLLLKSSLAREVGGLDEDRPIEDALLDLYGRLLAADHRVVVASGAWVHHVRLSPVEGAGYGVGTPAAV